MSQGVHLMLNKNFRELHDGTQFTISELCYCLETIQELNKSITFRPALNTEVNVTTPEKPNPTIF